MALSDAPLRDRSLLIEGNTIRDVLSADAAAPAGAQVLDLSGKFIIPGLFDSHVHWEEWMGELFVNHGVTSIVALENVPKALRARSQDAQRSSAVLPHGGRPQFSNDVARSRYPPDGADLALERTRFGVVRAHTTTGLARAYAIAADEAHKAGLHDLRPYRQRSRLAPRRNGHHRAYLGLRRSRHVAGAAAFVSRKASS